MSFSFVKSSKFQTNTRPKKTPQRNTKGNSLVLCRHSPSSDVKTPLPEPSRRKAGGLWGRTSIDPGRRRSCTASASSGVAEVCLAEGLVSLVFLDVCVLDVFWVFYLMSSLRYFSKTNQKIEKGNLPLHRPFFGKVMMCSFTL